MNRSNSIPKRLSLIIILLVLSNTIAFAQNLDIHFNGSSFLDNREYKDYLSRSHTFSGTRLALDLGLNLDSLNSFIVGVNGLHEFGAKPFMTADPVAYYKFQNKSWLFQAGQFPREGLLTDYPRALLNDTLRYYRPNVQGLLAQYHNEHFTETGWIDWVSRQTDTDREQFLFGLMGKYRPNLDGPFYVSHYFVLLHDAKAAVSVPDDNIKDSGGAQIRLGLDFSHKTFLDSLSVEVGGMTSIERTRGLDGIQTPKGFIASVYLGYSRFALFNEYYNGQGSHITYGDGFYQNKMYNRLDMIYTPFLFNNIKGSFVFSLHKTPGFLSNQEAFRITYDLGRKVLKRF